MSLLVDTRSYRSLLRLLPASLPGLSSSASTFRALSVSEGEIDSMVSFDVTTGLVSALSRVLAAAGISIFYFSTYQTDLVVIKAEQVKRATDVLKQHFGEDRISVEYDDQQEDEEEGEMGVGAGGYGSNEQEPGEAGCDGDSAALEADCNAATYMPGPTQTVQAAAAGVAVGAAISDVAVPAPAPPSASVSTPISVHATMQLYSLPQEFTLAHFTEAEITSHLKSLLQLFFFPPNRSSSYAASSGDGSSGSLTPDRFFSYSNIEHEVSMQVDDASLSVLSADHACDFTRGFERWRAFHVSGQFGFDECGIVAALSSPLTQAGICPYYLSTFFTDYFLVQEGKWDAAKTILEQEFRFVARQRKPKVALLPTATLAPTPAPSSFPETVGAASHVVASVNPYAAPLSSADFTGGGGALEGSTLQRGLSSVGASAHQSSHPSGAAAAAYLNMSSADIAPSAVPILHTDGSKSHSSSSVSSAYDAVPNTHNDSRHNGDATSPYAPMDTADVFGRAPAPALSSPALPPATRSQPALSLFSAAALTLPSVPAASVPAPAPSSDPAFDALFTPVQMGSMRSSAEAAAAPAVTAATPPAAVASLHTLVIESLPCYRPRIDKDSVTALLRVSDGYAPAASPAYLSHEGDSAADAADAAAAGGLSAHAGHGLFLLRQCTDPAELLPSGAPNPDLFVLAYNRHGKQVKSKVYRIAPPHVAAPALSLGTVGSGHRLFPSLQALVSAVVGPQARPVA